MLANDGAHLDANPKTAVGATKVPLHLVPPSARHFLATAFEDGARKYGPYNWRDSAVSVQTYIAAAGRHLDAFLDGENTAADSGAHHLAHVMACCAIVLDAMTVGKLVDDRPTAGAAPRLQAEYVRRKTAATATQSTEAVRIALSAVPSLHGVDPATPDAQADSMLPDNTPPAARAES
jgi:hypothetical protein